MNNILHFFHLFSGSGNNPFYWLDGTDIVSESQWVWAKREEPFDYTNWYPGNPNNDRGQDCLCLLGNFGYKWDDMWCDHKGYFICKRPLYTE